MRRDFQLIAGATAAVAAVALATQVDFSRPEPPPVPPTPAADAAPAEAPAPAAPAAPAPDRVPELAAAITRLTAALHDREAELTRLRADLDRRDLALDRVTAALAARDREIRELREELAALRAQAAFDAELAALKAAAAPPPTPAAAPAVSRTTDALLAEIQFDRGSAGLTPGAHMRGLAAAAALDTMQLDRIRVVGHADTVGDPERNRALSLARATTVAELLVTSGIPRELIETAGMGWDDLPIATPAQTPEPLNRSVSIIAVPTRLASAAP
jgi:outer membrane protein OmpA-like peptidoglycan-associated protein